MTEAIFTIGGYLVYWSAIAMFVGALMCLCAVLAEAAGRMLWRIQK